MQPRFEGLRRETMVAVLVKNGHNKALHWTGIPLPLHPRQ